MIIINPEILEIILLKKNIGKDATKHIIDYYIKDNIDKKKEEYRNNTYKTVIGVLHSLTNEYIYYNPDTIINIIDDNTVKYNFLYNKYTGLLDCWVNIYWNDIKMYENKNIYLIHRPSNKYVGKKNSIILKNKYIPQKVSYKAQQYNYYNHYNK